MPEQRLLSDIAKEILKEWKSPYFGAVPYIYAMREMETLNSTHGEDSAKSIINYFLANAQMWRGDVARRVKAELKDMLAEHEKDTRNN
jgi:hypothetical protein